MPCIKKTVTLILALCSLAAWGQSSADHLAAGRPADKSERKLIYRVEPYYPQDLKRFYIGGTVRLKLMVSARGTVETVSPLGGNPALVDSSVAAVKKWKYAPADNPTEIFVTIDFDPHH
ncbi:MAG TPA: energy transducer TonB [Terriglobales bacterium]|nr:energy transducer TonB [Terriglobales bacterium]